MVRLKSRVLNGRLKYHGEACESTRPFVSGGMRGISHEAGIYNMDSAALLIRLQKPLTRALRSACEHPPHQIGQAQAQNKYSAQIFHPLRWG